MEDHICKACGHSIIRGLALEWCPLHAAAEEMRALLSRVAEYPNAYQQQTTYRTPLWQQISDDARALLAKVGG